MGLGTKISWPDATINPWVGCSRGCKYCYMYSSQRRNGNDPAKLRRTTDATSKLATAKRQNGDWWLPSKSLVFVCSWSDFFDTEAPDSWRYEFFEQIKARPDVTFALLTKSVENMARFMGTVWAPNVWLGVTVEDQAAVEHRLPYLAKVNWPALRFVSAEPLYGELDLTPWANILRWVIVGGQSGQSAVPMQPAWARSIRRQCQEANTDLWFSQWGAWHPEAGGMRRGKAPAVLDGAQPRIRPLAVY